jgi:ATP:ADP antiporter, AAA family
LLLNLTDEERKIVFFSSLLLFLVTAAFVVLKTARDSLFLTHYSPRTLPYFMAFSTMAAAVSAALFLRLYKFFSLGRIMRISFIAFALITFLLWVAVSEKGKWISGLVYVWATIFGTIAPVQAWALASQQFSTRQTKRTVGIIGGGAILGSMTGGFFARALANQWHVSVLVPVSAFLILAALLSSLPLTFFSQDLDPKPDQAKGKEFSPVLRHFVILMLVIVATGTIVSAFIDFQFKTYVQAEFKTTKHMAIFFGSFYAYLGSATLFFQVFITPVLLRRFGVSTTLVLLPATLLIGNGFLLFTGFAGTAVFMRGSEDLLRYSVDRSSLEVLYVAMPPQVKVRLKSLIDTIGVRIPEALAALFLIAIFSIGNMSFTFLASFNLTVLIIWLTCSAVLGIRQYPLLLKDEIERKVIDIETVKQHLFTTDFYRLLPNLLLNADKEMVLSILELLEMNDQRWLARYLAVTLDNKDQDVRLKSLQLLFYQNANLSHQVQRLLQDKDHRIRQEAVHYLCLRSKHPSQLLEQFKDDPDLGMQVASCSCSQRKHELDVARRERLLGLLEESLKESRPDARVEIAHVLEFTTQSLELAGLYKRLLLDPSLDVRKAVLRSIIHTRPPGVVTILIYLMRVPALLSEVRAALAGYGDRLIPSFKEILEDQTESLVRKKLALKIAADIGGLQALDIIVSAAQESNLSLRFSAIKALNSLRRQNALDSSDPLLVKLFDQEIKQLELEINCASAFLSKPSSLLAKVLKERVNWSYERLFRLLGLFYEPVAIYSVYLAWTCEDPRRISAGLELLEHTISQEHRKLLSPVLESSWETKARTMSRQERIGVLISLLTETDPLLQSAAILDLSIEEFHAYYQTIKTDHPLVAETLAWRQQVMQGQNTDSIQSHPVSTVQKLEDLSKVDIFSKLGTQELLLLAGQANQVEFDPDQVIFREGEQAKEIYTLISGLIELRRSSEPVGFIRAGESFGTMELLTDQIRLCSAHSLEKCSCLKIDRDVLWEILEDYPSVCRGIIQVLVQQIQVLTERLNAIKA